MFRVKRKDNGKIYQVLDVYCEPTFHHTYSLFGKMMDGVGGQLINLFHQM